MTSGRVLKNKRVMLVEWVWVRRSRASLLLLFSHSTVSDSLWTAGHQAPMAFTVSQIGLRFTSFESVMLSKHLILCCPLLLLPLIFPTIKIFSKESTLHFRWLKYWSFNFSISPSREYSGLISFRID